MVRFNTICSEFCHFNGPFLRLWHHQIHIRVDRLCRLLSGEAITLKGRSIYFPELHFSHQRQRAPGAASSAPSLRYPTVGAGVSRDGGNGQQREKYPLEKVAGRSPASLLLCCCFRRVATAAVSDSPRTTSDDVGADTALPCTGCGVPRSLNPGYP